MLSYIGDLQAITTHTRKYTDTHWLYSKAETSLERATGHYGLVTAQHLIQQEILFLLLLHI